MWAQCRVVGTLISPLCADHGRGISPIWENVRYAGRREQNQVALSISSIRTIEYATDDEVLEAIELAVAAAEAGQHSHLDGLLRTFVEELVTVVGSSREGWLLDWWRMCRFGERSNGQAFQLDSPFGGELQRSLETLRALASNSDVPVLIAVRHWREFDNALRELRELVHHDQSKSKVQGATWEEIETWYYPVIEDLIAGRPADPPSRSKGELRNLMKKYEVRPGSELWRKIERDWESVDEACRHVVAMSHAPSHSFRGTPPQALPLDALDSSGTRRRVELMMLADVFGIDLQPDEFASVIDAPLLRSPEDEEWLAVLAFDFLENTRRQKHRLSSACVRVRQARKEIARLERADIDVSQIERLLNEGNVSGAEAEIDVARSQRSREDRRRSLEVELGRLSSTASSAGLLEEMQKEFDLAHADLADDALDIAAESIAQLRAQLKAQIDADRIEMASDLMSRLIELGGTPEDSVRSQLERAREEAASLDDDAVTRLARAVEQAETSIYSRVEERIRLVRERLDDERQFLDATVVDEVARTLDDAGIALAGAELVRADRESRRASLLLEQAVPRVWEAAEGEDVLIEHVREYARCRLGFAEGDIDRLYVALKTKKFAILSGLTGSGKSTIARLFAESVGATPGNGQFVRVAVRPNWVDETEVLGYVNPTSGRFEPGWLALVIRACHRAPDLPLFCLLDEMNLAPVEYYLADYLSAVEEAGAGAEETSISLYSSGSSPTNADEWPSSIPFPDNLFLIGTVNVDESTRPLSDRVLDRANVIQLNVEVGDRHHGMSGGTLLEPRWQVRLRDWRSICASEPSREFHESLVEIGKILVTQLRLGIGVRAHIEIERFVANAKGVIDPAEALDAALLQRLIPKIKGFKRDLNDGLEKLKELLAERGSVRCVRVLEDWLDDSLSDDTFIDGTAARVGLVTGI